MPFSYMEEKDEIERIVRGESRPEPEALEKERGDDSLRENSDQPDRPVEGKSAADSTEEGEQRPEHVCESCQEDFGIEKPASRKVRVNGREKWLCDSCLSAIGYGAESSN